MKDHWTTFDWCIFVSVYLLGGALLCPLAALAGWTGKPLLHNREAWEGWGP